MELQTTSEEELNTQAQQAIMELHHQISPRPTKSNLLSVSSYVLSMTDPDQGPSRCPTSKECGQLIMKLKNEVWDLKCRLAAEKMAKTLPTTTGSVTTLSAANVQDLTREFQSLKDSRDTADRKIQDLENENKFLRDHLVAGQHREEILQKRNQELIDKLDILDHELALANMRRTEEEDLIDIDRSMMTFQLDGDFPPLPALVPLPDQTQHTPLLEEQQKQITGYEEEVRELKEKLDIATEDATAKSQLIESLEILLKEKNELLLLGDQETSKLKDKIIQMTVALKEMGYRHNDEQILHNSVKSRYRELLGEYENVRSALEQMKRDFEAMTAKRDRRSDDLSPDLGIESGIEMPTLDNVLRATKDNSAEEKIRSLKALNKELANKLRHTKLALDKTLERLSKTTAEKDLVEQAVCRQLHRTHGILRQARKNLENPSEPVILHDAD